MDYVLESWDLDEEAVYEEIRTRCRFDIQLFAELFFPHYCKHDFNAFHLDVFAYYSEPKRAGRYVRAAPRGYAKSTITALIKPIHDACYGLERFVVIVSNNQLQANAKLKDIRSEILFNNMLIDVYRVRFPRSVVGETEFTVHCGDNQTAFKAVGTGAQVRGIRVQEARPSKIICDDVEHSEEVENEELRSKYESWFFEDLCKLGDENTNIEFIGTVLHKEALLSRLLINPSYDAKSYRAVLSWATRQDLWDKWTSIYSDISNDARAKDAKEYFEQNKVEMMEGVNVLWPEKEPYYSLMIELIEQGRRSFFKEKQGEPMASSSRVFEKFHWYREEIRDGKMHIVYAPDSKGVQKSIPVDSLEKCFGVIDPATGKKKAKNLGDFTCLLIGYKDPWGRLLVHRDWTRREPPATWMRQIFDMHDHYKFERFGVEVNLYQELLLPNLTDERKRREERGGKIVKLGFYEILQTANKIERITALEPKVTHGWVLLNQSLSQEFKSQLENFPGTHDDCPDALEMLWGMAHNRYKVAGVAVNTQGGR